MSSALDGFFGRIDTGREPSFEELMDVANSFGAGLTAGLEASTSKDVVIPDSLTDDQGNVSPIKAESFVLGVALLLPAARGSK